MYYKSIPRIKFLKCFDLTRSCVCLQERGLSVLTKIAAYARVQRVKAPVGLVSNMTGRLCIHFISFYFLSPAERKGTRIRITRTRARARAAAAGHTKISLRAFLLPPERSIIVTISVGHVFFYRPPARGRCRWRTRPRRMIQRPIALTGTVECLCLSIW